MVAKWNSKTSKNAKCDADFESVEENEDKNHPKMLWTKNFCAQ
jgi:hypothetical protein